MLGLLDRIEAIRIMKGWILAFVFIMIPLAAQAEWLDFIGTAARAGADAYIHTIYINAIERQIITLEFLIYAILATVQAGLGYLIIKNFRLSFTSANKDNTIKWLEGVLLGIQAFVTVILCIGLIWSAYYYTTVVRTRNPKRTG